MVSRLAIASLTLLGAAACGDATTQADPTPAVAIPEVEDTTPPAGEVAVEEPTTPADGTTAMPAIDFVWFDGTPGSTTEFVGTPTVLNFWGSWCPPCIAEMPDFEAVSQALAGRVTFVGMNVADDRADADELAAMTGVTYRLAADPDSAVFQGIGGFVMPTTAFIDERGDVVFVWAGALTGEELRILIDRHLLPGSL